MARNETGLAYIELDRERYSGLLSELINEISAINPAIQDEEEQALRDYFAIAVAKGADFARINLTELAYMTRPQLEEQAEALPDKLSREARATVANAEKTRRQNSRAWDILFPDGTAEITLPLSADSQTLADRLNNYITAWNFNAPLHIARSLARVRAGEMDERHIGNDIRERTIRLDPEDSTRIQTRNPRTGKWSPPQRLGRFLEDTNQWALLDDFQWENSRQHHTDTTQHVETGVKALLKRHEDIDLETRPHPYADLYPSDSLMIVLSRDPQKIAEMSSKQHWDSCMGEGEINFEFVPKDVAAGTLIAYVTNRDDPQARYPLMRVLLKPYINHETGEVVLIPGKVYGAHSAGNSEVREALLYTLQEYIRDNLAKDKAGKFLMDSTLYADGQPGMAFLNADWTQEAIIEGLKAYHDNMLQDLLSEQHNYKRILADDQAMASKYTGAVAEITSVAELQSDLVQFRQNLKTIPTAEKEAYEGSLEQEVKRFASRVQTILGKTPAEATQLAWAIYTHDSLTAHINNSEKNIARYDRKIRMLADNPRQVAKGFYRQLRQTTLDTLPEAHSVLSASTSYEVATRHKAIDDLLTTGHAVSIRNYLADLPDAMLPEEALHAERHKAIGRFLETGEATAVREYLAKHSFEEGLRTSRYLASITQISKIDAYNYPQLYEGIPTQAETEAVTLWMEHVRALATPEERASEIVKVIGTRSAISSTLVKAASEVLLEDIPQLPHPYQRVETTTHAIHYRDSGREELAGIILDNVPLLHSPRQRFQALESVFGYPFISDAKKLQGLQIIYEDLPNFATVRDRVAAADFLVTPVRSQISAEAYESLPASLHQDAIKTINDNAACELNIGGESMFGGSNYGFYEDTPEVDRIRQYISNVKDADRDQDFTRWVEAVDGLPLDKPEWRVGAAELAFYHHPDMPVEWRQKVTEIMMEETPRVSSAMDQIEAYQYCLYILESGADKTQVAERMVALLSNGANNIEAYDRTIPIRELDDHVNAHVIDRLLEALGAGHPLFRQYGETLSAKIEEIAEPEKRARIAAYVSLCAPPESAAELRAVERLEEYIGELPTAKDRMDMLHTVLQLASDAKRHSKAFGQEEHGDLLLRRALNLINREYDAQKPQASITQALQASTITSNPFEALFLAPGEEYRPPINPELLNRYKESSKAAFTIQFTDAPQTQAAVTPPSPTPTRPQQDRGKA